MKGFENFLRIGIWSVFLITWEIFGGLSNSLPKVSQVSLEIISILQTQEFFSSLFITSVRSLGSVMITVSLGGLLLALSFRLKTVEVLVDEVIIKMFYSLPTLVTALLILVLFGLSPISPFLIIVIAILPYFMISMREGVESIDKGKVEMGKIFLGKSARAKLFYIKDVILPQLYPQLISSVRIIIAIAFKIVVIAEYFTASGGLGYQLQRTRQFYDVNGLFAWASIIILIIISIDFLLRSYEDDKFYR